MAFLVIEIFHLAGCLAGQVSLELCTNDRHSDFKCIQATKTDGKKYVPYGNHVCQFFKMNANGCTPNVKYMQ